MSQFTFSQSIQHNDEREMRVKSEGGGKLFGSSGERIEVKGTEKRNPGSLLTPQGLPTTIQRRGNGQYIENSIFRDQNNENINEEIQNGIERDIARENQTIPQVDQNVPKKKKQLNRRQKQEAQLEEEPTVYQTLYGSENQEAHQEVKFMEEDRISNLSSRNSQASEKILREFGQADQKFLEEMGIPIQSLPHLFPLYFNEPVPNYNPKSYKQSLILYILDSLVKSKVPLKNLVSWTKTKENKREAILKLSEFNDSYSFSKILKHIEEFPQEIIRALGASLHLFNMWVLKQPETQITVRLACTNSNIGITTSHALSVSQSSKINKLLVINGRIITRMTPKLLVLHMPFKCQECNKETVSFFYDGIFRQPSRCSDVDCLSKAFTLQKEKAKISVIQRFVVQCISQTKDGNLMDQITCEARDSTINLLKLNKIGLISGVWKTEPAAKVFNAPKSVQFRGMYDHFLEVNNVEYQDEGTSFKKNLLSAGKTPFKDSIKELLNLTLTNCPLNFYVLIGNICPTLKGQELAKACIALSLAGGVNPSITSLNPNQPGGVEYIEKNFKSNIHLMLLGERGTGKIDLIRYVESLSPQNNLFEGKGVEMNRLTCNIVKEANTDVIVNPGILPLSNKGVCCVDGLDKIEQIQNPLIEVIERKILSVAKKGGFEEFECDTTIIACVEPKGGKLK